MKDLYEQIKHFKSDNIKIEYNGRINIYIKGDYPIEMMNIFGEYGKTHHLRLRRIYDMYPDGVSFDRLFIAGFVDKKERPYQFVIYSNINLMKV